MGVWLISCLNIGSSLNMRHITFNEPTRVIINSNDGRLSVRNKKVLIYCHAPNDDKHLSYKNGSYRCIASCIEVMLDSATAFASFNS